MYASGEGSPNIFTHIDVQAPELAVYLCSAGLVQVNHRRIWIITMAQIRDLTVVAACRLVRLTTRNTASKQPGLGEKEARDAV